MQLKQKSHQTVAKASCTGPTAFLRLYSHGMLNCFISKTVSTPPALHIRGRQGSNVLHLLVSHTHRPVQRCPSLKRKQ